MAAADQGGCMKINIHIERLLLDGFDATPRQQAALKSAFETQLSSLLAQDGIGIQFHKEGAIKTIHTEPMGNVQNSASTRFGERIARSVHGGLR